MRTMDTTIRGQKIINVRFIRNCSYQNSYDMINCTSCDKCSDFKKCMDCTKLGNFVRFADDTNIFVSGRNEKEVYSNANKVLSD